MLFLFSGGGSRLFPRDSSHYCPKKLREEGFVKATDWSTLRENRSIIRRNHVSLLRDFASLKPDSCTISLSKSNSIKVLKWRNQFSENSTWPAIQIHGKNYLCSSKTDITQLAWVQSTFETSHSKNLILHTERERAKNSASLDTNQDIDSKRSGIQSERF